MNIVYISFYIYLIAWKLICYHWFHAVFIQQPSAWWLSYKDSMKPVVSDKNPCNWIYIKANIYLYIIYIYTYMSGSKSNAGSWIITDLT